MNLPHLREHLLQSNFITAEESCGIEDVKQITEDMLH